jgi:hypothetical protein
MPLGVQVSFVAQSEGALQLPGVPELALEAMLVVGVAQSP